MLIGFAVFLAGSLWCGLSTDLPGLLSAASSRPQGPARPRCLSRAIARDLFSGAALARAMALIMIAMAAAPGFSPLLGGALDHFFGWRSEFAFIGVFAALAAMAYGSFSAKRTARPAFRSILWRSQRRILASRPIAVSWFRPRPSA